MGAGRGDRNGGNEVRNGTQMTGCKDGGSENTRYPWEAVLGKRRRKKLIRSRQSSLTLRHPVQPQEQAAPQSDAQTTDPQAAGSYHWVNPEYQKRQNGTDGEERTSQNTYENQNYREDVSGTADAQNRTETTANEPNNGGWGQPVGGNQTTKETERQPFFRTDNRGLSEWQLGLCGKQSEQPEYAKWRSISEREFLDEPGTEYAERSGDRSEKVWKLYVLPATAGSESTTGSQKTGRNRKKKY
ncbi:MAG: hypothetical protein ACLSHW_00870 [Lachnospiraceae bacterium]